MKNKKIILVILVLIIAVALYSVAKTQYYPSKLVVKSEDFIQLLYKKNLERAYDMTTKKGGYYDFSTPNSFKEVVKRQTISFKNAEKINVEYQSNFPYQSYGNRIRRWVSGKDLEPDQKSVDFRIYVDEKTGNNAFVPFEVRWVQDVDKNWKISFFQSHAI